MLKVNLALQGGGAHGAFTWGVLDRLLDEKNFTFEGVSGASAGAMNAVVMTDGWLNNGRQGAQEALAEFWGAVSSDQSMTPNHGHLDAFSGLLLESTTYRMTQALLDFSKYLSPTELNPLGIDPLKDVISRQIDFDRLRSASPFKLFIAATEANTGRARLFRETELTELHLLASACLPTIHEAVVIDGVPYWDGGFSANPALYPLVYECEADDLLLVMLQALSYDKTPTSAEDIQERVVEMGFQNILLRELRSLGELQRQADKSLVSLGHLERRLRSLHTHLITSDSYLDSLERATKFDTRGAFLAELKKRGQETADNWLSMEGSKLGVGSSIRLYDRF